MPAKIKPSIQQTFRLPKTDALLGCEGEASFVEIRQANALVNERRENLYGASTIVTRMGDNGKPEVYQNISYSEQMRVECELTIVSSNLLDENGERLFRVGEPGFDFGKAWGRLDPITALEIHDKVLEVNVNWAIPK